MLIRIILEWMVRDTQENSHGEAFMNIEWTTNFVFKMVILCHNIYSVSATYSVSVKGKHAVVDVAVGHCMVAYTCIFIAKLMCICTKCNGYSCR